MPREGHLKQVFHILAYLKGKNNTEMIFDPSIPEIDGSLSPKEDWSSSVYATSDCELKEVVAQGAKDLKCEFMLILTMLVILLLEGLELVSFST
jgi:hypothetical protein